MTSKSGIDADIAFGEALGASLLVGALLKRLVQKNLLSNNEVIELIDHVLLRLEKLQGAAGAPAKAIARARKMLEVSLSTFSAPDPKTQAK
jgi:hypothetical protein